ncbi:unnamed protein product, partial [Rhizoctonia solani]
MFVHEGHTNLVSSIAFSPDGQSVVSGSDDYTVRIWDACSSYPIGKPLIGHGGVVFSAACSPLGNLIASGSGDNTIRLWDPRTGQQSGEPLEGHHKFYSVAFSPNARLIASGSDGFRSSPTGNAVQLWNTQTNGAASVPLTSHTDVVRSVSFSPDGARLVSGSEDKTIRVWDVEQGETILGPLEGHSGAVRSISHSPDGTQIGSGSSDGTIRLWDPRTGGIINKPYTGHTDWVRSVSFSPRGTYLVSGGDDGTVRLWDVRTSRQVGQPFKEHTGAATSVAFSPCGQFVASGSLDRRVIVRKVLDEDQYPNLDKDVGPQMVTSQMSTQQIFECLCRAGCTDLSSQMDTRQESAMIASGGGFGDIWKGEMHSGEKVAIKAWRTTALELCEYKTLKRAARELHLWSRMDHPHIHRLQGVILFRDQYLGMVSEWMNNGNLHDYLLKHPGANRFELCIHVASGLEYMHSCSIVHGDLKAVNVLVSSEGIARISDFDFSIMSEASGLIFTTTSQNRAGSVRWVAPEMLTGETPERNIRSDVYALGMTILLESAAGITESTTPPGSPPLPKIYPIETPIETHLNMPSFLAALLPHISFRDWNALNALNAGVRRRLEETRALREEVLEYWLRGVGYARWKSHKREQLTLTLRDLNAYMRGVSMAMHRYSAIAESF